MAESMRLTARPRLSANGIGLAFLATLLLGISAKGHGQSAEFFYAPPYPLPPGAPGVVIRQQPVVGAAALPPAGRNVLVLYHSRLITGKDVAVSGTVAVPRGQPPKGGWPVILWTHCTTGMVSECSPSRDSNDGP